MTEYDKKAILWLQVPVTGSELNALMRRANLLGTGTAWEALRERTDLPDKPNGYVKWAREQEKIARDARKEQEKFTATLIASSVTATPPEPRKVYALSIYDPDESGGTIIGVYNTLELAQAARPVVTHWEEKYSGVGDCRCWNSPGDEYDIQEIIPDMDVFA